MKIIKVTTISTGAEQYFKSIEAIGQKIPTLSVQTIRNKFSNKTSKAGKLIQAGDIIVVNDAYIIHRNIEVF